MTRIEKSEVKKLLKDNPHLRKYVMKIEEKMGSPTFYSKVPREVKEEELPNIIYTTKGTVFIHIFKMKDMDRPEYHAITPKLGRKTKRKRDIILEMMYEQACFNTGIKTQEDLRLSLIHI